MAETVDNLYVVFTMDCLPCTDREEVRGPARWDDAERSAATFADALRKEGFEGTFFVAPEVLGRLSKAVGELRTAGAELGMLCHPQLSHYQAHLGAYGFDRQREIVQLATATWADALGEAPTTFRPGFFSAKDYTFHVLCMEGFRQGSCSLPGRTDEEQYCLWHRSYPFPHHTDPLDRTLPGTMEFFEVPVTSDFEAASRLSYATYTPPHLRIEEPDVHDYARDLVVRHLDRMVEDKVGIPTLTFITSNAVGWHKDDDPHVERLQNLCQMLREVAEGRNVQLTSTSLEALHEMADRSIPAALDLDDIE